MGSPLSSWLILDADIALDFSARPDAFTTLTLKNRLELFAISGTAISFNSVRIARTPLSSAVLPGDVPKRKTMPGRVGIPTVEIDILDGEPLGRQARCHKGRRRRSCCDSLDDGHTHDRLRPAGGRHDNAQSRAQNVFARPRENITRRRMGQRPDAGVDHDSVRAHIGSEPDHSRNVGLVGVRGDACTRAIIRAFRNVVALGSRVAR